VVGEHIGLAFYTIGQRKGIGVGGLKHAPEGAWYVAGKDMGKNELIVVQGHDHPLLLSERLEARDLSWTAGEAPDGGEYGAKNRYRQADAPSRLLSIEDGRMEVSFTQPQWAVTPGQSVVLYSGEVCLGGGVIQ